MQIQDLQNLISSKIGVKVDRIVRMKQGISTEVYNINPDKENLFLRIQPTSEYSYYQIVYAHEKAVELGIKVPHVVFYEDFSIDLKKRSFMIVEAIPGRNTESTSSKIPSSIFFDAGCDMAKFNSIKCEGYGWIKRRKEDIGFVRGPFSDVCDDFTYKLDSRLKTYHKRGMLNNKQIKNISILVDKLCSLKYKNPVLCHTDISYAHIFAVNGVYKGIIDFDDLRGSNVYLDLAEASISLNRNNDFENFFDGYKSIHNINQSQLGYEFRLTRLFWAIEKGYWVIDLNPDISKNKYYTNLLADLVYLL